MREYSFAEALILITLISCNQTEKTAVNELEADFKELQELELIGWLPPGTANKAYEDYKNDKRS